MYRNNFLISLHRRIVTHIRMHQFFTNKYNLTNTKSNTNIDNNISHRICYTGYVTHKTYGNYTWIITHIVLPFWIIYGLTFMIFRYSMIIIHTPPLIFYYATDMGFVLFQIVLTIVIGKIIWNKYPITADIWLIRQEIAYSLWIILFSIICIIVVLSILIIAQILSAILPYT